MKSNISSMDVLTDKILKADMARKKLTVYNIKAKGIGIFLFGAPIIIYNMKVAMSGNAFWSPDNFSGNHSQLALKITRLDQKCWREICSPEIYYREKALIEKEFATAVSNRIAENNDKRGSTYKPYTWS